jgi:hypothetical protein
VPIEDVVPVPVDDLHSGLLKRARPEPPAVASEAAVEPIATTATSPETVVVIVDPLPIATIDLGKVPAEIGAGTEIVVATPPAHDEPAGPH